MRTAAIHHFHEKCKNGLLHLQAKIQKQFQTPCTMQSLAGRQAGRLMRCIPSARPECTPSTPLGLALANVQDTVTWITTPASTAGPRPKPRGFSSSDPCAPKINKPTSKNNNCNWKPPEPEPEQATNISTHALPWLKFPTREIPPATHAYSHQPPARPGPGTPLARTAFQLDEQTTIDAGDPTQTTPDKQMRMAHAISNTHASPQMRMT